MSSNKKWIKVRKPTKSGISENIPIGNGTPPSPPTRINSGNSGTADLTFEYSYGSGSTILSRGNNFPQGMSTLGSSSSIDTLSAGLTPSPSTTPPKKTWERNYKSFLRRGLNHDVHTSAPPGLSQIPRSRTSTHDSGKRLQPMPVLPNDNHHEEDTRPSLADGFQNHLSLAAPPSPSASSRDSSHKGGNIFKRFRTKNKSHDNLDSTLKRGVDRKSPSNTPPGSHESTPRRDREYVTQCIGEHKASALQAHLSTPHLNSSSTGRTQRSSDPPIAMLQPYNNLTNDNGLDKPRHRGQSLSSISYNDSLDIPRHHGNSALIDKSRSMFFSRVQSIGHNLAIREGEPSSLTQTEEEVLIRERKKAFTDFHNMGIDSTSAFLGGDDSSVHQRNEFLASMAYPAGSAGGKAPIRHTPGVQGPHSMDRNKMSPSLSSSNTVREAPSLTDAGEIGVTPLRALRSIQGPEKWNKGERYAISPAVLSMLPISVLTDIMSKDVVGLKKHSNAVSASKPRVFGIGSSLSDDDADHHESGWFFGEQNHVVSGGQQCSSSTTASPFAKVVLGKATVATLGIRSFVAEVHGWCAAIFVLRQNFLFEYRENDNMNGLPWGYAMLQHAEAYPHKHFENALHLEYFEKPCCKSGKRCILMRVESRAERDRWVSLLHAAAKMTIHDMYEVDDTDDGHEFGRGRYAVVRPAKRRLRKRTETRHTHVTSHENLNFVASGESLSTLGKPSNNDISGLGFEYDCALKIIDKKEFWSRVKKGQERPDTLVREVAIQTTLAVQGSDAPILRIGSIFETGEHLVVELELLEGTDLFQHISSYGVLDEVEAAHIMKDLLNCLNVMDQVGVCHRDIKPANLLMVNDKECGARIKLADFGMASFVSVDNLVRGRCGTPGFVAPEILLTKVNGGYGNKVDVFSAGVTLYVMLVGYEPFFGESDEELINANKTGKVDFPHADWHKVSVEGRDLLERMLEVDPTKRIGPTEALRHPWIRRRAP